MRAMVENRDPGFHLREYTRARMFYLGTQEQRLVWTIWSTAEGDGNHGPGREGIRPTDISRTIDMNGNQVSALLGNISRRTKRTPLLGKLSGSDFRESRYEIADRFLANGLLFNESRLNASPSRWNKRYEQGLVAMELDLDFKLFFVA